MTEKLKGAEAYQHDAETEYGTAEIYKECRET